MLKKIFRWLIRGVLGLVGLIVIVIGVACIADSAVVHNFARGPSIGNVAQTERNQPQEAVPGKEVDDIPVAANTGIAPAALAAAEAYATQTESVALLVYHKGVIAYEKYWPGYDRNFRTDPFSAHKTIMGLLLGAAIADGYIKSVDEFAYKYLPEWANDERRNIRIRDLLTMTSGLHVPRFGTWTFWRVTLGSDLPETVFGLPAEVPPGTSFQYSNANSQLLGIIIQRATGKRYAQYLSERLWSRIGAQTAYVWLDHQGGIPRTFCCIYTNARSWLHVGKLILNHGRFGSDQVIPEAWIQQMTTPSAANPNYGYQVWLGSPPTQERKYNDKTVKAFHSEPFVAKDMIFIDGFGGQRVYMVPSQDLIVVRTGKVQQKWDDAKIPNAILRGLLP